MQPSPGDLTVRRSWATAGRDYLELKFGRQAVNLLLLARHSTADVEQFLKVVAKQNSADRSSRQSDDTVESILDDVFELIPSDSALYNNAELWSQQSVLHTNSDGAPPQSQNSINVLRHNCGACPSSKSEGNSTRGQTRDVLMCKSGRDRTPAMAHILVNVLR